MGNGKQIELAELLIRDANILKERLEKTDGNQFEPNITEKSRISTGLKSCRRKISNLIALI